VKNLTVGAVTTRLRSWFPDREFFMRSHGQVRFITITSRMQIAAVAVVLAVAASWGISLGVMAFSHYHSGSQQADLLAREARVESAENRVAAYGDDLKGVTKDLQRRQAFIEKMVDVLPNDVRAGETVSDSTDAAAETIGKVSMVMPEAGALARIEARQLAFVERLTRYADRRAAKAEQAIRHLGLNPATMLAAGQDQQAQGGPLDLLSTGRDGSIDPRFERLGLSLARMDALERGLKAIPQVMPADISMISSGFGYRADPFNGHGAMHAGLDFRGPIGSPIHAAAKGVVSFVGQESGYGNVVEISHGKGLMTRYAHMSAFHSHIGQPVEAGQVIGAIGSTGRSTGPHLHFEVRINGRAVNPRPFLESAPHVLEEARNVAPGTIAGKRSAQHD
jgi:murein DD-endopeptidase MepM/ murein hydrolase activator NlpD